MINPQRLSELTQKIQKGMATQTEKDDYMWMLFQNGSITKKQFDGYMGNNDTSSDLLNAGLTIGAIILLGLLIKKISES